MAVDVVLTPFKRLTIFLFIVAYFIVMSVIFLRTLSEQSYSYHDDNATAVYKSGLTFGNDSKHLHVFIQISDLHLSIYHDRRRGPELEDFCNKTIPIIKPEVVLVTGDLIDAKYPDKQGSKQFEEEWKQYYQIITTTNVLNKTVWLDIKGNHDDFDVASYTSSNNYYRYYSVQGRVHNRSYHYAHKSKDGDVISFIGFDACPLPGPRRPFNFFGVITEDDLNEAEKLDRKSRSSNLTIWFGHYPTSVITGGVDQLRAILGRGSVYLSGHLHTLGGLTYNMYARQHAGYLELEVGDWMDNRIVFVLDHGLFSFIDVKYNSWPIVLITNPKHGQFIIPHKEPLHEMRHSTHIRILVFSPAPIQNVSVRVDDKYQGRAVHSKGPLYTIPWNATHYDKGRHTITVYVQDLDGREKTVTQPFTLDQTQIPFGFWPRFILLSQHQTEGKVVFLLAFLGTVLPMILSKLFNFSIDVTTSGYACCNCLWLYQLMIRRYRILANTPSVFWPLLTFHFYTALGPWFIGEILKGHIGAMFVYGLFVKGTFIPGSLTYLYGFFQFLLFNFPLTQYIAHVLDQGICQHKRHLSPTANYRQVISWVLHHGMFVLMLIFQAYLSYAGTYLAYGLIAVLLCPVRTWSVPFALLMQFIAQKRAIPLYMPVKQTECEQTQL